MISATNINPTAPAQLWLGHHEQLASNAKHFLQHFFCKNQGCKNCTVCLHIEQNKHHAIIWLQPEKNYTIDTIEPIFKTIAFALQPEQHFFFVLTKADLLSAVCANSLLKSIEEPPTGYHFLFLAQRREAVLSTIRSRCVITEFYDTAHTLEHTPLLRFFLNPQWGDPTIFLQTLDKSHINEHDTIELLDTLLKHWLTKQTQALADNRHKEKQQAQNIVDILSAAALNPPMPGSSKLFWKNLFLQFQ